MIPGGFLIIKQYLRLIQFNSSVIPMPDLMIRALVGLCSLGGFLVVDWAQNSKALLLGENLDFYR